MDHEGSRLVLLVKNKEDSIEGILHILMNSTDGFFEELIVADMGSDDETLKILLKLSEKYGNLKILSEKEKEKIFCG
jgi:glycosyltransferase involved in cell wall biosynthesis